MPIEKMKVRMTVNGQCHEREVEPRTLLVDFLRSELRLTGTHVGCAHGSCGACTVLIDGRAGRSCSTLALQAEGAEIRTVESLAAPEAPLHPIQQAFHECHALQCGYCTPGFLMATSHLLQEHPDPSEKEIRAWLAGNLCRCTGYVNIVRAVKLAAQKLGEAKA
jgi:aerobic carbon-monoxide dehydrogenase small subunit